jgi:hypothetical protein
LDEIFIGLVLHWLSIHNTKNQFSRIEAEVDFVGIPSFFIRKNRVVGFRPSISAAPFGPLTFLPSLCTETVIDLYDSTKNVGIHTHY